MRNLVCVLFVFYSTISFGIEMNNSLSHFFHSDTLFVNDCHCPDGRILIARPAGIVHEINLDNYQGFWCGRNFWVGYEIVTDQQGMPIRFNTYYNGSIIDSLGIPFLVYTCTFNFQISPSYNKNTGKFKVNVSWTGGNGSTLEFRLIQKGYIVGYWTASDLIERSTSQEMELETGIYQLKIKKNDSIIHVRDVSINANHY